MCILGLVLIREIAIEGGRRGCSDEIILKVIPFISKIGNKKINGWLLVVRLRIVVKMSIMEIGERDLKWKYADE